MNQSDVCTKNNFHNNAHPKVSLKFAVKGMDDTLGENGLVRSRVVFGTFCRFPVINNVLLTPPKRIKT